MNNSKTSSFISQVNWKVLDDNSESTYLDKEFNEIRIESKESILENLLERRIMLENDLRERENKLKSLNTDLEHEFKRASKMFDKKLNIMKNLDEEIKESIKENQAIGETYYNELKEVDDAFIQKTKEIRTSTAINYSGRLRSYDEMLKQVDILEEKRIMLMHENESLTKERDRQSIKFEEDYLATTRNMLEVMLKTVVNFAMQIKLLELSNENDVIIEGARKVGHLKSQLEAIKENRQQYRDEVCKKKTQY